MASLAVEPERGSVYVSGWVHGASNATFGTLTISRRGAQDAFLVKVADRLPLLSIIGGSLANMPRSPQLTSLLNPAFNSAHLGASWLIGAAS